ncbi:hypothetical protein K439DRAFT_1612466 [Ramaria rubella]|nr:hypothetical protein K439DRAFT_1612466 [Ramaria rubella]
MKTLLETPPLWSKDLGRARAWVRAPDLEVGRVVQGHVKIKLDGICEEVSSYSLGLRFAERAWVKTRREGITLPEKPTAKCSSNISRNDSVFSSYPPFAISRAFNVEPSVWQKYEDHMKNPALWLTREEERIGFEEKYELLSDHTGDQLPHDVFAAFAILVPSTSYPPAFDSDSWSSPSNGFDSTDSEHIYLYYVDVVFANGTSIEIPAGYTSFKTHTPESPPTAETVNVLATNRAPHGNPSNITSDAEEGKDTFTLEVTFPMGRHVEQGSLNNITILTNWDRASSDRNALPRPIFGLAADNETAKVLLDMGKTRPSQLKATNPLPPNEIRFDRGTYEDNVFPREVVVEDGTHFTTQAISTQFKVPKNCYPPWKMYFQTTAVELSLVLTVRNISTVTNIEDDDDYNWIPIVREIGERMTEYLWATIPLFIHPKEEDSDQSLAFEATHYLSPEARTPTFVHTSKVTDLLQKSVAERDALTPKAQAKFIIRADGDIVKNRYYGIGGKKPNMYYVGDTWLRKVVVPWKEQPRSR